VFKPRSGHELRDTIPPPKEIRRVKNKSAKHRSLTTSTKSSARRELSGGSGSHSEQPAGLRASKKTTDKASAKAAKAAKAGKKAGQASGVPKPGKAAKLARKLANKMASREADKMADASAGESASASLGEGLACIVLAAGKGTRMRSAKSKVLHTILGAPVCTYPIDRAREVGAAPIVAVLGHQRAEVEAVLKNRYGSKSDDKGANAVIVVEQTEQKGTGHAVRVGLAPLAAWDGLVLILYGDAPLLRRETIEALLAEARRTGGLAILTARLPDPTGYGRILRDKKGRVLRVVEQKDASKKERKIDEVNAGFYAAPVGFLRAAVDALQPNNAQGEYYLTDIVEAAGKSVGATTVISTPEEISGINDRLQLTDAEEVLRVRSIARFATHATFRDAASTVVEPSVQIGTDVEIGRNVSLRGKTIIGDNVRIDDGVILTDTEVGAGAEIKAYSVASESVIGSGAKIGPFAHLRPGTELGEDVHIGNFVETKKTRLGKGAKANHLTYLGDAIVGEKVNVGAGTITCNYNGYEKRQTIIEDGAFIGSDSQLIAPVRVGKGAVVAAGATITGDVPAGALAITRVEQRHIEGYAAKVAARYRKTKPGGGGSGGQGGQGGKTGQGNQDNRDGDEPSATSEGSTEAAEEPVDEPAGEAVAAQGMKNGVHRTPNH
jgi:bifunctional UDP-N-acetylglucosamine pyrophosphorylase/glucosamine-1-phosphate N-acetyltransferase